jgi:Beta-glucosidase-related glycosidases
MKLLNIVLLNCIVAILAIIFATSCNSQNPQLGKALIDDVIKALTLEEKATLVIGTGMAGTTHPIARLGIPAIVLVDGSAGVRISPIRQGDTASYFCSAFPVGTLLASTWNTELIEGVGTAMGKEALDYGVDILLAPALNIHRNPLNGRNFEYYSEDPVVSGKIAAAMINGIESTGVGASIKHFAANNQETNRISSDSRLTQRALREIYLKGFEIAITESDPWTVMSAYNKINGVYAPENYDLLTQILRYEWSYNGMVMSDWHGGYSAPNMIFAGNDLLMPGLTSQKEAIIEAVKDGILPEANLDISVKRILEVVLKSPKFNAYHHSDKPDLTSHAKIARQSAAEGMVLLKNSATTLPINTSVKTIAVYGISSYDFISGGKGSSDVNSAYTVSLVEGLESAGYIPYPDLRADYEKYIESVRKSKAEKPKSANPLASHTAQPLVTEIIPTSTQLQGQAEAADIAIITIGRISGEFLDRKIPDDFNLSDKELQLIKNISSAFHSKNKRVIVILNVGGVVETASWKNYPDAILLVWQPGQEGGNSVADVLSGKENPSGKLTMSFPLRYEDVSSAEDFPYDFELTESLSEAMLSRTERAEPKKNIDYTNYTEGIFVGYRYFDTFKKPISYPFGYGLSYTTFEYSNLSVEYADGNFTATLTVKNIGNLHGKEVVQLYVTAPLALDYVKPQKELKAFAKTRSLAPGQSQSLTMLVSEYDLASFSEADAAWIADAGEYKFMAASSSQNVLLTRTATLPNLIEFPVNDVMTLKEPFDLLSR